VLRYYVAPKDWRTPFARVVKDFNAHHVGVRLVKARVPEQASIQVGRLVKDCNLGGVEGTTQTIAGGYAAIYLPRHCRPVPASIIAAHELGHALGLLHEDRRCALLNSSGTGSRLIPTRCLGRSFDWLHHPYRADDIKGLRRLYHNTPPRAHVALGGPDTAQRVNDTVRFSVKVSDRERNVSEVVLDFGDGTESRGFAASELERSHTYTAPGRYRVRLSVVDFYLRRATSSVTVDVTA
jgi:hypothetical protein